MSKEEIKIFILEDDQSYRNIYKTLIENHIKNYNIQTYFYVSASEAISSVRSMGSDYWDIYICDLKIPFNKNFNGSKYFYAFDFIKEFSLKNVIIVSGYISPEILKKAVTLGVMNVLEKPFRFEILVMNINFIMQNRKLVGE